MKYILLLLIFACGQTSAQKAFKWPKPIKDSIWIETKRDTMHGIIKYRLGVGEIIGKGIVVTTSFTHWSQPIYTKKDQERVDSFRRTQRFWLGPSGRGLSSENQTVAYIKTTKGYEPVLERHTFTPDTKVTFADVTNTIYKFLNRLNPR